ncbi:MAG TPA: SRPBCC family protein [Actinopolymorphaceae bacterium]|jgi:carbon monoxide dehydrogenase subunit G
MLIEAAREIPLPAEQAWQLLVDWERQGEWIPATTVRRSGGSQHGIGTRLEAATGVGRLRLVDPMLIVTWDPPRVCVVRHEGAVLKGTGTFEVQPLGADRCRVTWREELESGAVGRVPGLSDLLGRLSGPLLGVALARFETFARANAR